MPCFTHRGKGVYSRANYTYSNAACLLFLISRFDWLLGNKIARRFVAHFLLAGMSAAFISNP